MEGESQMIGIVGLSKLFLKISTTRLFLSTISTSSLYSLAWPKITIYNNPRNSMISMSTFKDSQMKNPLSYSDFIRMQASLRQSMIQVSF